MSRIKYFFHSIFSSYILAVDSESILAQETSVPQNRQTDHAYGNQIFFFLSRFYQLICSTGCAFWLNGQARARSGENILWACANYKIKAGASKCRGGEKSVKEKSLPCPPPFPSPFDACQVALQSGYLWLLVLYVPGKRGRRRWRHF